MKRLAIIFLLALPLPLFAQGISQLQQFTSTTSPSSAITQTTYGKALKITGLTTGQCLTLNSNSLLTTTSCGGGGGTFPFTPQSWGNSTSTTLGFLNGLFSTASSTFNSSLFLPSLSQGLLFNGTNGLTSSAATTTLTASSPLSLSNPVVKVGGSNSTLTLDTSGTWSGNAGTATALAANGTNCSAGSAPLGVDASGNSESCFDVWSEAENTAAAYAAQATTLTVSGTANQITSSAGAQSLAANRTWTLSLPSLVIFPGAASSTGFSALGNLYAGSGTATSTIVGNATSTFGAGVQATALNITSGTSTFANGIQLAAGCFRMPSGTCLSSGGSGTPGGSDTQVQFNDGGSFGGSSRFTFDKTSGSGSLNGGGILLNAGDGGTISGNGGSVVITSGNALAGVSNGGDMNFTTGSGFGGAADGTMSFFTGNGDIFFTAGSAQMGMSGSTNAFTLAGNAIKLYTGGGAYAILNASSIASSDKTFTFPNTSGTFCLVGVACDGSGTVTSVGLSVPTGLSVSGSPVTTSGTLALSLTSGYQIPQITSLAASTSAASATNYVYVFSFTPPASKTVRLDFFLNTKTDSAGVAVQYAVQSLDTGNVGDCLFRTPTGATTVTNDVIAIASSSADTGETAITDTNPFPVRIECTFSTDSTPGAVVLAMETETGAGPVWTMAGSYYTWQAF